MMFRSLRSVSAFFLAVGLGATVTAANGCSSSPPESTSGGPVLNGNYQWQGSGAPPGGILQMSFFATSYSMFVTCDDDPVGGCFDYGTYSVDEAAATIVFQSSLTSSERTLPFQSGAAQALLPSGSSTGSSVRPQDLVAASDGGLVQDGPALTTNTPAVLTTFGMGGDGGPGFCLVCALGAAAAASAADGGVAAPQSVAVGPDLAAGELHPTDTAADGHAQNNGSTYDIWSKNCHNAANADVLVHPLGQWGIISCCGSLAVTTQQGHTFSYQVDDGGATFYNWGTPCVATDKMYTAPPDISSGAALACVRTDCGNQYNCGANWLSSWWNTYTTVAMPPGALVEAPGSDNCVAKAGAAQSTLASSTPVVRSQATFNSCNSCCNDYANFWTVDSGTGTSPSMRSSYLTQCLSDCRGTFGMN